MVSSTYNGEWRSYWEMFGSFCREPKSSGFAQKAAEMPNEYLVVYAEYNLDGYEGDSVVVYLDPRFGLMANFSSHCSCDGLAWSPEPVSVELMLNQKNENLVSVIKQKTSMINGYLKTVAYGQNTNTETDQSNNSVPGDTEREGG